MRMHAWGLRLPYIMLSTSSKCWPKRSRRHSFARRMCACVSSPPMHAMCQVRHALTRKDTSKRVLSVCVCVCACMCAVALWAVARTGAHARTEINIFCPEAVRYAHLCARLKCIWIYSYNIMSHLLRWNACTAAGKGSIKPGAWAYVWSARACWLCPCSRIDQILYNLTKRFVCIWLADGCALTKKSCVHISFVICSRTGTHPMHVCSAGAGGGHGDLHVFDI